MAPYVAPPVPNPVLAELAELDKSVPRGAEDLYDSLIAKGVLTPEDCDPYFVEKVNLKKTKRAQL